MKGLHRALTQETPAVRRLDALAPLDDVALTALLAAMRRGRRINPRREIVVERARMDEPLLIVSGWAARVRLLEDGRRQILHFLLPGDLVGNCRHARPLATSAVLAIGEVEVCAAPSPTLSPALDEAYALARAIEESHLLANIARLGRMNADERISDLLLELLERLTLCGLADGTSFPTPVTQEMLADATGLTPVHVNRTLQALRRKEEIVWKGSRIAFPDIREVVRKVGRSPVRVSAPAEPAAISNVIRL